MSSETTSPSLSPEAALALLQLPDADALSDDQRRGKVCVWTKEPLTAEIAIDLGERQQGDGTFWFPRATRQGTLGATLLALQLHTQACEQCVDDYRGCQNGYALMRLARHMRQA